MKAERYRISVGWWMAFIITTMLVTMATLPPFVGPTERSFLYLAFSGACHQISERSPHLLGVSLAVCHRCYGAYVALPLAALVFRFARRWDARLNRQAPILLTMAVVIPGVDWFGDVLNIWSNTPVSRLLTGAVFGLTAGYFLSRALAHAFGEKDDVAKDEGSAYAAGTRPQGGSGS